MRGLSFESLPIEIEGPRGDREFMVVDDAGRFLTQRQIAKMALVRVQWDGERLQFEYGGDSLTAQFSEFPSESDVVVWTDTVRALHVDRAVDAFLSKALERSVRLFRYQPRHLRVKPTPGGDEFSMRFPDSGQILLTTEESRADLSRFIGFDLPQDRFRANVVVGGIPAWTEENWKQVRIGDLEFEVTKLCTRCKIITIDQQTAEVGSGAPLIALKNGVKGEQAKACFGVFLRVLRPGVLRLGDDVEFSVAR